MRSPLPALAALRAFETVARHLNFTRAAEELCVTQTAVSHQIQQLEAQLDRKLFHRATRYVELTDVGRRLAPRVREALERLQLAIDDAKAAGTADRLTVAAMPEFAARWLSPRLPSFLAAHPDLDVRVVAEYRRARFLDDGIDAAVILGSGSPDLRADRLMTEEVFPVASPALVRALPSRHAFAGQTFLRYRQARHTLLGWHRWLEGLGFDPEIVTEGPLFDTFDEMVDACRRGEGLALVRSSLIADDLAAGRLARAVVEGLPADVQYHLVCPKETADSVKISRFRAWLLAEASAEIAGV